MYLWLKEKAEKQKEKLSFFTRIALEAHKYLIHPAPDAYIAPHCLAVGARAHYLGSERLSCRNENDSQVIG